MAQKRAFNEGKRHFKKNKKQKTSNVPQGSNEEVLLADIRNLLSKTRVSESSEDAGKAVPEQHAEIELEINELSSTGDGLAEKHGRVYVVPFAAPGDTVRARVYKNFESDAYSLTDFLSVSRPSTHRIETPKCQYFTQCSGCQFQHLPYQYQLAHKRRIVEKAYENFSGLSASQIPQIGETIGSPLQYGYRTKLTPHFDGPPGQRRAGRKGEKAKWDGVPDIGYMRKGTRKTMDIEDCPIGTDAVRRGLVKERERVKANINQYARGATLLLRESTERLDKEAGSAEDGIARTDVVMEDRGAHWHKKTCITDHKATSTEYVDDFRFDNPAGSFFQNNNSILPLITQYIRNNIVHEPSKDGGATSSVTTSNGTLPKAKIKNMIDAYCGSGFFTVALSSLFDHSIGIDISQQSIEYAYRNAKLNQLPTNSTMFFASDANALFASSTLDHSKFPPAETVVIIDPPRKGCDENFIRQLMNYGPERICYVSCNVHTQARDVGWLVGGIDAVGEAEERKDGMYEIESLRGFDFFPQTGHVEGVAFLRKVTSRG